MANLVIPNDQFIRTIEMNLKYSSQYKMTYHLARRMLLYNDRARFWGMQNCMDSALDGTDIKYKENLDTTFTFYKE